MVDDFLNGIRKFQHKLERVTSQRSVSFGELYSDDFMLRYTDFASISALFGASPFAIQANEDLAAIDQVELDTFIAANTRFGSWHEMKSAAGSEWMSRRFREG